MNTARDELIVWLESHRSALIHRWTTQEAIAICAVDGQAVTTLTSATIEAADLYDAIVAAVRGDQNALVEQLRALAFTDCEYALSASIALAQNVCQSITDLTSDSVRDLRQAQIFTEILTNLFKQATLEVIKTWETHARRIIADREFLTESLENASAAADKRALQLQSLNIISRQLSSLLEEERIIDFVVFSIQQLTGAAFVSIWLPENADPSGNADQLILKARRMTGIGLPPEAEMNVSASHPTDLVALAFRTGALQFDRAPNPACHGSWLQPNCGALALPMTIANQVVAVTLLQDPDPLNQLRLQQELAQGVVGQAAIALQNARLYAEIRALNADLERRVAERTRELQDEKDRLATIHQISTEVSSTLDLDTLLRTSLKLLAEVTRAEQGMILLVEQPDCEVLVTRAVFGLEEEEYSFLRFPIHSGIPGWVVQHRASVVIGDVAQDKRNVGIPAGSSYPSAGALLAVPLIMQGEVLGVIVLSHHQPGFFHDDHLRVLNACAGPIAIGINNANLFQTISAEYERHSELLHQQRTEASKINAILQSLNDGVIVCDLYGSILAVNAAAGPILHRSVEELVVWNLHDLLARYLGPRAAELPLDELLRRPLDRENKPRIYTSTARIGVKTVELTLGPVLKDDGELIGALLVLRDITREIEADRMKTEFIGTMSHELRTPMTAIKGFTQLLLMGGLGPLTPTQHEFVTTIYNNTERMIAIINDVLDLTKIEAGSVELEWRAIHLAEVLSNVITEVKDLAAKRNQELTFSLPPGLPLVLSDAHRLHQILYNLVINAVKFTPRGGKIWIEASEALPADLPPEVREQVPPDRRYLRVDVRDTGVGISPDDLPRIFDRFYRTDNPLKIEAGGTGLGLSLVRPLVHLLGGHLWVRSTLGEGSTFSFILPAIEA